MVVGVLWWVVSGTLAGQLQEASRPKVIQPSQVPACGPAWRLVESPNPSKEYSEFHAISAVSSSDIWAAGTQGTEEYALTFTAHWDGKVWSHVQSPSVPGFSNHLHALAALSADDVWVVGASHRGTGVWRTLTMHWDGRLWSIVPSPTIPPISSLNGAASAPGSVWAVGEQSTGEKGVGSRPLILRWNGEKWSIEPLPPGVDLGVLNGITALPGGDMWAVGSYSDTPGNPAKPLTLRWHAGAWERVLADVTPGELRSVSGTSSSDVWAVGNRGQETITLHWDGNAWQLVKSPNPGSAGNTLSGVSAASKDDVWAVGAMSDDAGDATLSIHWDGRRWTAAPGLNAGPHASTLSGTTHAGSDFWAAGSYIADNQGTNLTVIERFTDPCP